MASNTTTTSGILTLLTMLATPLFSSTPSSTVAQGQPPFPSYTTPFPYNLTNGTFSTTDELPPPTASNLTIVDNDPLFEYVGCWTETTPLPEQRRALDGPYMNLRGFLTVPLCLHFCGTAHNGGTGGRGFKFGGLEHAQECWCGDNFSNHSYHLVDDVCDAPCDGANATACGGNLAITLYRVRGKNETDDGGHPGDGHGGDSPSDGDDPNAPGDEAVVQAVGVGVLALAVTFALGWGCL
ncbi:hypothetical protein F4677DRAFT_426971 [Hypoxylon crocopeplum]|nr:hypothetical protein F4677DRAFT_426971 [Hypoxylon crocopeplum]